MEIPSGYEVLSIKNITSIVAFIMKRISIHPTPPEDTPVDEAYQKEIDKTISEMRTIDDLTLFKSMSTEAWVLLRHKLKILVYDITVGNKQIIYPIGRSLDLILADLFLKKIRSPKHFH